MLTVRALTRRSFRLTLTSDTVIIHAAQNEAGPGASSPDHLLGRNRPPAFVDSALDLMAPYLEEKFSEPMREVVSSTRQALLNGTISSFHEINEHFASELLDRPSHFGAWGSPMSEHFSTMCR